ncbi:hypothetical protein [Variovorax sp. N23]|uniref:hypothetical protein n=1 Tax=Variovorax sp. N23 TaxID=2980555 RepID=UPI0021C6CAF7|nr:hypothetical protein [Variovorax sp. N23]MCU4119933.1 hypothetical protein [Variovorax sp. N23]
MDTTSNSGQNQIALRGLAPPSDGVEQADMSSSHPVCQRAYLLPSLPILQACNEVLRCLAMRRPSCAVIGPSRFGVTYACEYIAAEAGNVVPGLLVVRLVSRRSDGAPRSETFFRWMNEYSTGSPNFGPLRTGSSLEALTRQWQVKAASVGATHIALFIDAVHRLNANELVYLSDLINRLFAKGLRVTPVCFGSPEIVHLRSALANSGQIELIGQFFAHLILFSGLTSKEDLGNFMSGYDDPQVAEFPPGSGWSFSRFFFPTAYEHGWRLESEAASLWMAFQKVALSVKVKKTSMDFGAEYFSAAIENALVDGMNFQISHKPFDPKAWSEAVEDCGYREAVGVTFSPGASLDDYLKPKLISSRAQ